MARVGLGLAALLIASFGTSAQSAKSQATKPQTVELYITGSNCSYLFADFDTGLPANDARVCVAESHPKINTEPKATFILSCDARLATCMRLGFGQTYEMEPVNNSQYPECGKPSDRSVCVKVHTRPYDLIYTVAVMVNGTFGSICLFKAEYEDCKIYDRKYFRTHPGGGIEPLGPPASVRRPPPPLNVTVIENKIVGLPNGNFMLMARVRLSDAMITAMRRQGTSDADTIRFGLTCGGSHAGCEPLEKGETYWLQYIHPGDEGYSEDYDDGKSDCHPARFGRTLKRVTAIYSVCSAGPKDSKN